MCDLRDPGVLYVTIRRLRTFFRQPLSIVANLRDGHIRASYSNEAQLHKKNKVSIIRLLGKAGQCKYLNV